MSYEQDSAYITKLVEFTRYNRKAYTPNMLAKATDIPVEFVSAWISALEQLPVHIVRSPSGRFIKTTFNKASKSIYYSDSYCILHKGHLIDGEPYRTSQSYTNDVTFRRHLEHIEDLAHKDGLMHVQWQMTPQQWISAALKAMGKIPTPAAPLAPTTPQEQLAQYPLVLAQYTQYEQLKEQLQAQMEQEKKRNTDAKAWFDQETLKARRGERFRWVTHIDTSKIVGYAPGVRRVYKDSEWNGGNMIVDYGDPIPEYATYHVKEPDYPKEPTYIDEAQRQNPPKIQNLVWRMQELLDFPIKYEKQLCAQEEKAQKLKELEAQERALKQQIAALRSSM